MRLSKFYWHHILHTILSIEPTLIVFVMFSFIIEIIIIILVVAHVIHIDEASLTLPVVIIFFITSKVLTADYTILAFVATLNIIVI